MSGSKCPECGGIGVVDSGGVQPWGEFIDVPCPACCDHDWQVVDDSFDHEYGTEKIVFERCLKCDAERDYERPTFDDDVI